MGGGAEKELVLLVMAIGRIQSYLHRHQHHTRGENIVLQLFENETLCET